MSSPVRTARRMRPTAVAALGALVFLLAGCPTSSPPDTDAATPSVTATTPNDGAFAAVDTAITVTFDQPMNESAAQAAFSVSPSADCAFSWNGESTTVACAPDADLSPGETYTVTIGEAAESHEGRALGSEYTFSFTIVGDEPAVLHHSPDDGATAVPLNQSITLTFSEAMDEAATEAAVTVDPAPGCSFGWNTASDRLTCTPNTNLSPNTDYEVTLGTGARDAAGTGLVSAASFAFRTGTETAPQCTFGASEFGACVFAP